MRAALIAACFVLCACTLSSAKAEVVQTGELMLWCSESGRPGCGTYIMGVLDAPVPKARFCAGDARRIQIIDAVLLQMKLQPPPDSAPAGLAVAQALERAFPCPK